MHKDDNRLEEALRKTDESGASESEEISSLVNLAASIRELPHPEQAVETARAEKRRILAAAKNKKQKQSRIVKRL